MSLDLTYKGLGTSLDEAVAKRGHGKTRPWGISGGIAACFLYL
jgi:hypothetical protein